MDILKRKVINKEILIDNYGVGHAVAIRENGKLIDLFIDPDNCDLFYPPSTVLISKILRRVQKLGGYFIKLPNNGKGLLSTKKNYSEGQAVTVMAKVFSEYEKLQKFSDKLKVETKYFVIEKGKKGIFFSKNIENVLIKDQLLNLIKKKLGGKERSIAVIIRSAVETSSESNWNNILDHALNCFDMLDGNLNSDAHTLLGLLSKQKAMNLYGHDRSYKIIEREGVFDTQGIWDNVEKLLSKKVSFGNKSHLIIEQTSAFCAIDVNTGGDLSIEPNSLNLYACKSIFENIRLRAIGGKIIIDFLPCSKKNKLEIQRKLVSIFALEGRKTKIMGWTRGNNFEIERARDKIPLNLIMDC